MSEYHSWSSRSSYFLPLCLWHRCRSQQGRAAASFTPVNINDGCSRGGSGGQRGGRTLSTVWTVIDEIGRWWRRRRSSTFSSLCLITPYEETTACKLKLRSSRSFRIDRFAHTGLSAVRESKLLWMGETEILTRHSRKSAGGTDNVNTLTVCLGRKANSRRGVIQSQCKDTNLHWLTASLQLAYG